MRHGRCGQRGGGKKKIAKMGETRTACDPKLRAPAGSNSASARDGPGGIVHRRTLLVQNACIGIAHMIPQNYPATMESRDRLMGQLADTMWSVEDL